MQPRPIVLAPEVTVMVRTILLLMMLATISVGAIACGGGMRDEAGADQPSDRTAYHQCSEQGAKVFGGQCYVIQITTANVGGWWTTYNPCPPSQPFQHCSVYGICYCSAYP